MNVQKNGYRILEKQQYIYLFSSQLFTWKNLHNYKALDAPRWIFVTFRTDAKFFAYSI
jgi:hypothetical protein